MLEAGKLLEEWTASISVPLPKKEDIQQCNNYMTISIMSVLDKILLRVGWRST